MAVDEKAGESEPDPLDTLRQDLLSKMSAIQDELRVLSERVRALESRRAITARTVAASVLSVLFIIAPIATIAALLYYLIGQQ